MEWGWGGGIYTPEKNTLEDFAPTVSYPAEISRPRNYNIVFKLD